MKIKEAVDIINGTLTVKAMYNEHSIFMCYKLLPFDNHCNHCFLTLRADTRSWGGVTLVSSAIDGVIAQDLARVMDVVQRLIDTPVKERFSEKKYRLVADLNSPIKAGMYATKYVAWIKDNADGFSFIYGGATLFSEKELKEIEKLHPHIAPAIEAMKEEVKDDAC